MDSDSSDLERNEIPETDAFWQIQHSANHVHLVIRRTGVAGKIVCPISPAMLADKDVFAMLAKRLWEEEKLRERGDLDE